MKTSLTLIPFLIIVSLLVNKVQAQTEYKIKRTKASVAGTSTLHEWESEVKQLECNANITIENSKIVTIKDLTVKIPVTSIKSTKGSMMDNKTYEAFKYEKYPNIIYKLTAVKVSGANKDFIIDATGTLTMAGTSKSIGLSVKAIVLPNGEIQFIGNKKLNMKDFNMEPPTAMLGSIKVGEEVTVSFDLIMSQSQTQTQNSF